MGEASDKTSLAGEIVNLIDEWKQW